MSEEKAAVQQGKGKKKQGKGPKASGKELRAQREAQRQQKLARKIERAGQPDTAVVDKRALETNAIVALIGKNDYLIDQLRKKVGFDRNINTVDAINVIQINQVIREILSVQNSLICHTLGLTYEPPKGLDVPVIDPKKVSTADFLAKMNEVIESAKRVEEEPAAAEAAPAPALKAA